MSEAQGGDEDDATKEDDASLGEPVDLDQLAPDAAAPDEAAPASPRNDDAARAQAVARKLAGGTGRRGAVKRSPSTTSTSEAVAAPALSHPPTTGVKRAANPQTASVPPSKAAATARRPLVDPSQRKKKSEPFYAKVRVPKKPLLAVVALVVLVVGGWFGWRAYDRHQHANEYAVRDELFLYKFDHDEKHFANIDGMGATGVQLAIDHLTDMATVETSFGKSSTTTAELAHMYLMHYAQRVGVDPPAKALEVAKMGGVRQTPADWAQLKDLWGKWFADVQAKGKAR